MAQALPPDQPQGDVEANMSYIRLKQITKIYMEGEENEVRALAGVDLEIEQGGFHAIVGASGSG